MISGNKNTSQSEYNRCMFRREWCRRSLSHTRSSLLKLKTMKNFTRSIRFYFVIVYPFRLHLDT